MMMKFRKIAIWLLTPILLWCVTLGTIVWRFGMHDRAIRSDCIIVLGAAVQGNSASPVFSERIRHGIHLHDMGYAPKILFTGGIGKGQSLSESGVGRSIAIQYGIPPGDILIEEHSHTTRQNLSEALAIMRVRGMDSAIIVSDPLHMKRAMLMADDLAMSAVPSPTPTSQYRTLRKKLDFLLRELYFIHHYQLTGD
jgi:uncharacterized SAM-binding protein YcdF (DUF218 family)